MAQRLDYQILIPLVNVTASYSMFLTRASSSLVLELGESTDGSEAGYDGYVLEANKIQITPNDIRDAAEITLPSGQILSL